MKVAQTTMNAAPIIALYYQDPKVIKQESVCMHEMSKYSIAQSKNFYFSVFKCLLSSSECMFALLVIVIPQAFMALKMKWL